MIEQLARPGELSADEFARAGSRLSALNETLELADRVEQARKNLMEHETELQSPDGELRALAKQELPNVKRELERLEQALHSRLVPPDPLASHDVILELRAGTGGEEAALFAAELFSMYTKYAEKHGWTCSLVSTSRSERGGYKEIIVEIHGTNVYGTLRFESGVHRVQRIPETEKTGRVHTSTATVAVLPVAELSDVEIRPQDLRIDTFRAGGHGGQHVQKTESAVRITHLPTGLVVQCQDERSQQKNKERALGVLRSRLLARHIEEQARTEGAARRAQIGTGDRSEKIRTYNIPQNRITDHRIKRSWHGIDRILSGDLDAMIADLKRAQEEQELTKETDPSQ